MSTHYIVKSTNLLISELFVMNIVTHKNSGFFAKHGNIANRGKLKSICFEQKLDQKA